MAYRRSLTPSPSPLAGGDAAAKQRRQDARWQVSERVLIRKVGAPQADDNVIRGWALNISRGGVRAVVEGKVTLGEEYELGIGETSPMARRGRVVWVQEEPDGLIVGIEFLNLSGAASASEPPPGMPPAESK